MPIRKILLLSAVLAILAGVAIFADGPGKRHQRKEPALLLPDFDSQRIATLNISGGGESLSLVRQKEGWSVRSAGATYPADGEGIERALDDLKTARLESVASTNIEKRALFGVDGEEGVRLFLEDSDGAAVDTLVIGLQGPDPFSGYLLHGEREEVLLVSPSLRGVFARGVAGWRDREIVKVDREEVTGVVIGKGDKQLTLAREGGEWTVAGRGVDRQAVEEYLDRLVALKASDFAAEEELSLAGLDEPAAVITLARGGETLTLSFGALKEEKRQRYLRRDAGTVFLISQYTADSLLAGEDDFPPPAAPEGEGPTEP